MTKVLHPGYTTLNNAGDNSTVSRNETRRYSLPLNSSSVRYEQLSEYGIELPTINYRRYNTHDYGVAYRSCSC